MDKLQFYEDQVSVICKLPDRPNIFLQIVHQKSYDIEEDLKWVVRELHDKQGSFEKTIIFAQTIMQAADIFEFIKYALGDQLTCMVYKILHTDCFPCFMARWDQNYWIILLLLFLNLIQIFVFLSQRLILAWGLKLKTSNE